MKQNDQPRELSKAHPFSAAQTKQKCESPTAECPESATPTQTCHRRKPGNMSSTKKMRKPNKATTQ
jgi:hypothetical protein